MKMSSSVVQTSFTPSVSLTIGNVEIVNMLVQSQVEKMNDQRRALTAEVDLFSASLIQKKKEILVQMALDFAAEYGDRLTAYGKAYGALHGITVSWRNPYNLVDYGQGLSDTVNMIGSRLVYFDRGYSRTGRSSEGSYGWKDLDVDLKKKVSEEVSFSEIPTVQDLKSWDLHWKTVYASKELAVQAYQSENSCLSVDLEHNLSESVKVLVRRAREVENQRLAFMAQIAELDEKLKDIPNIEKQILATVTRNTLENNPQLSQAFGVLTQGLLTASP